MSEPLLALQDVAVRYPGQGGALVLDGVTLAVPKGESLALIGESGCGKTTLARALVGLVPLARGRIRFEGQSLEALGAGSLRAVRRRMQLVFQDSETALDPRRTVAESVAEGLVIHHIGTARSRRERVLGLLGQVGLPDSVASQRPDQLSGGQRQRVGIARALALDPVLLIADEPTSALDVALQVEILDLLAGLKRSLGFTLVLITHDYSVVRYSSERIAVMHQGRIVEEGATAEVLSYPRHAQTRALVGPAAPEASP